MRKSVPIKEQTSVISHKNSHLSFTRNAVEPTIRIYFLLFLLYYFCFSILLSTSRITFRTKELNGCLDNNHQPTCLFSVKATTTLRSLTTLSIHFIHCHGDPFLPLAPPEFSLFASSVKLGSSSSLTLPSFCSNKMGNCFTFT